MTLNCTSTIRQSSQTVAQNPKIQREWMLVAFGNFTKPDLEKNKAKIDLTGNIAKGKIKGGAFMGCNDMFFDSEFKDDGSMKISGIGSTMKSCQNMDLETLFSKNFRSMIKYFIEGHFLTLSDNNGQTMKFVAADWD